MPVENKILDIPRRSRHEIVAPISSIQLGWPVFQASDIVVYKDTLKVTSGFSVTGTFGVKSPALDATVLFESPQQNCVLDLVDSRPPQRVAQFPEGHGVSANDRNWDINQLAASIRDLWDEFGGKFLHFLGEYDPLRAYIPGDVVVYLGSTWVNRSPGTGVSPPSLPLIFNTNWHLLAAKGEAGSLSGFSSLDFPEVATPSNPPPNTVRMFARDVGGVTHIIIRDSAGTEIDLGSPMGASKQDESAWGIGVDDVSPVGLLVDDTASDVSPEGSIGLARMSSRRVQYAEIRDSLNERSVQVATDNSLRVVAGGYTVNPEATFTRPADTTAYSTGDLVANSTTAGSVVAMVLPAARVPAGSFMIRRIRLRKSGTSLTSASFRVHLWTTAPTVANGDNGVFSASGAANYIGAADVILTQAFTDGAVGFATPSVGSELARKLSSGTDVFALVEARAAYTPVSGEIFSLQLDVLQD